MKNFKEKIAGMNAHYRFYQLETFFASLAKQKIHYAELWTGPMHFYVDEYRHDKVSNLLELQKKYDVSIIGICPEQTNPKPNNIATSTRIASVFHYYEQLMEVCDLIDCHQVLVTSGWGYLDEERECAWDRSVSMMKRLAVLAKQHNVTLVIEALQPEESNLVNNIEDLTRYLDEVQEPSLQVCIDMGAMAKANDTLDKYFQRFKEKIKHIHFVDGAPTGHLAWGDGKRRMEEDLRTLKTYGYQGYLSLETATSRYYQTPWKSEATTMESWSKLEGGSL